MNWWERRQFLFVQHKAGEPERNSGFLIQSNCSIYENISTNSCTVVKCFNITDTIASFSFCIEGIISVCRCKNVFIYNSCIEDLCLSIISCFQDVSWGHGERNSRKMGSRWDAVGKRRQRFYFLWLTFCLFLVV